MDSGLPGDFALDALTAEVERRRARGCYGYNYGRLIADTTLQEREQIVEEYRRKKTGKGSKRLAGGTESWGTDTEI